MRGYGVTGGPAYWGCVPVEKLKVDLVVGIAVAKKVADPTEHLTARGLRGEREVAARPAVTLSWPAWRLRKTTSFQVKDENLAS